MSSSVANAQHLQRMELYLGKSNINFLQSILPCLASSQSLQELAVACDASGVFSGCAMHTCICRYIHVHRLSTMRVYVHTLHTHTCELEMYGVLFDWCMCDAMHSVSLGFFH